MIQNTVTIPNSLGLHARPAALLVKEASQYKNCEIYVEKDGQRINAKSIMGVLMLAAEQGSELTIFVEGDQENEALAALTQLVANGFGEK